MTLYSQCVRALLKMELNSCGGGAMVNFSQWISSAPCSRSWVLNASLKYVKFSKDFCQSTQISRKHVGSVKQQEWRPRGINTTATMSTTKTQRKPEIDNKIFHTRTCLNFRKQLSCFLNFPTCLSCTSLTTTLLTSFLLWKFPPGNPYQYQHNLPRVLENSRNRKVESKSNKTWKYLASLEIWKALLKEQCW